jgi:hypothetical protein
MTALLAAAWLVLDYPWGLPAFVAGASPRLLARYTRERQSTREEHYLHS